MCTLERLPWEMWFNVFSYFELSQLCVCQLVCRAWRGRCHGHWDRFLPPARWPATPYPVTPPYVSYPPVVAPPPPHRSVGGCVGGRVSGTKVPFALVEPHLRSMGSEAKAALCFRGQVRQNTCLPRCALPRGPSGCDGVVLRPDGHHLKYG